MRCGFTKLGLLRERGQKLKIKNKNTAAGHKYFKSFIFWSEMDYKC